jgi:hypothetical protein
MQMPVLIAMVASRTLHEVREGMRHPRGWRSLGDGRQDAWVEVLRRVSRSPGDWETVAPQDEKGKRCRM